MRRNLVVTAGILSAASVTALYLVRDELLRLIVPLSQEAAMAAHRSEWQGFLDIDYVPEREACRRVALYGSAGEARRMLEHELDEAVDHRLRRSARQLYRLLQKWEAEEIKQEKRRQQERSRSAGVHPLRAARPVMPKRRAA